MGSVPRESILNLKYISCERHIRKINDSGCPSLGISFMIFVYERQKVAESRVGRNAGPELNFHLPFTLGAAPFRRHGLPSPSLSFSVWSCGSPADQQWTGDQACKMCPTELCVDQSPSMVSAVSTGSQEADCTKRACTLKV